MIDNTDMLNTVSYVEVAKVETKQAVIYQSKAWRVSNLTKRYNKTKKNVREIIFTFLRWQVSAFCASSHFIYF